MKNILFAIGYSKFSENTWKYVLRIAQYSKASVTIMHVIESTALLNAVDMAIAKNHGVALPNQTQEHYKRAEKRLQEFIDKHKTKQYHSITINALVKEGEVIDTILVEEQMGKYDLLVLGVTSTKFWGNRIMGNVSKSLMNASLTPVFLVPPSSHFRGIDKIVYATNFKYDDIDRIKRLMEWMSIFDAELHILHIYEIQTDMPKATAKMNKLIEDYKDFRTEGLLIHQLIQGNVTESIRHYISITKVHMIALNTHRKGLLARLFRVSETDKLTLESVIPVLVFK